MAKPSIFSSNYERIMKRRRRIRNTIIIVLIIAVGIIFSYLKGYLNLKGALSFQQLLPKWSKNSESSKMASSDTDNASKKDNEKNSSEAENEKYYNMKINDNLTIKVIYEENSGAKKLESVDPSSGNAVYSISPQGSGIIVYDDKNQSIIYMNSNGSVKDITNPKYIDSQGTVYTKGDVLNQHPGYIWCEAPRFINENVIAYISELPWINDENNKYLWTYNLTSGEHISHDNVYGKSVSFGNLTDKGLSITADSQEVYIDADGNITK